EATRCRSWFHLPPIHFGAVLTRNVTTIPYAVAANAMMVTSPLPRGRRRGAAGKGLGDSARRVSLANIQRVRRGPRGGLEMAVSSQTKRRFALATALRGLLMLLAGIYAVI